MNHSSDLASLVFIYKIIVYKTLHRVLEVSKPIKSKVELISSTTTKRIKRAILRTLLVSSHLLFQCICDALGCHLIHDSIVSPGWHL